MKENKELKKFYNTFSKELLGLQRGSLDVRKRKSPLFKILDAKSDSIDSETLKKAFDTHQQISMARNLTFNGFFIYSFSIFERFLDSITKYLIEKDEEVGKRYENKFDEYMTDEIGSIKNRNETKSIISRMRQTDPIEFYDDLQAKDKIFSFSKYLFQVNEDDEYYKYAKFRFTEARLRRNMIVHRGTKADAKYKSLLKDETSPKEYKKFINSVYTFQNLVPVRGKDNKLIEQNERNITDLSITPNYLRQTLLEILYIGTSFYISAVKEVDISSKVIPLMEATLDFKNRAYLMTATQILKINFKNKSKKDLLNINDDDKINFIVSMHCLIGKKGLNDSDYKTYTALNNDYKDLLMDSFEDKRLADLAAGYVNKDIKKILNALEDIKKNGLISEDELKKINKNKKKKLPKSIIKESGIDFLKSNSRSFFFKSARFIRTNKQIKDFFNKKELKMNRQIKISRKSKND